MMKIKIYQINMDRDDKQVAFKGTMMMKRHGVDKINSSIYDAVYVGSVDCEILEDVFEKFNIDCPAGYKARSLSVSDVIEVIESDSINPSFYFCDSYGFKEISFEPDKTQISECFYDGEVSPS